MSTITIGPFRTALLTLIFSLLLLGEGVTSPQTLGAAMMIALLCAIQFARAPRLPGLLSCRSHSG